MASRRHILSSRIPRIDLRTQQNWACRALSDMCGRSRPTAVGYPGVLRETAINDDGLVFTRNLDHNRVAS